MEYGNLALKFDLKGKANIIHSGFPRKNKYESP